MINLIWTLEKSKCRDAGKRKCSPGHPNNSRGKDLHQGALLLRVPIHQVEVATHLEEVDTHLEEAALLLRVLQWAEVSHHLRIRQL